MYLTKKQKAIAIKALRFYWVSLGKEGHKDDAIISETIAQIRYSK